MEATRIPLFPLGSVLFPGAVLPLHIFEERYRTLVRDLADGPEGTKAFGVVAIRQGREVGADGVKALYDLGTMAILRGIDPYPDGRYDIVTVGGGRFRLLDIDTSTNDYLVGIVEPIDDADGADADRLAAVVRPRFAAYRAALQGDDDDTGIPHEPGLLAWTAADGMLLDLDERQRILAADDTDGRLRVLRDLLRRELALFQALPSVPALELGRMPMSAN